VVSWLQATYSKRKRVKTETEKRVLGWGEKKKEKTEHINPEKSENSRPVLEKTIW